MIDFRAAVHYAQQGWPVFPCRPTKAPYEAGGHNAATTDPAQIARWSADYPDALLGLSIGQIGLFVVDIDVKAGAKGVENWAALLAKNATPDTYVTRTASGGLHCYFRGVARTTAGHLAPGIDTRGVGGYVIAYPPANALPIADAPAWLLTAIGAPRAKAAASGDAIAAQIVPAAQRRALTADEWLPVAARWPEPVRSDAIAVIAGAPWGERGQREPRLSRMCVFLMRDFPWVDSDGTAALFAASCRAVDAEDQDPRGCHTSWVAEKLESKRVDVATYTAAQAADRADGDVYRAGVAARGATAGAVADDPWILGTPQGYFLRAPGGIEGPFSRELVPARARDALANAPVALTEWVGKTLKPKSTAALLHEYGRVPAKTEYSLFGQTRFADDCLTYCPLRPLVLSAERDEQIEHWLSLLAGQELPAFLDWLATCRDLSRPTCGVFVRAFPGVGKGLLIDGLAALWATKAVPFAEACGAFNGAIAYSPLVIADETLAAGHGINAVDELKKMVGDSSHRVNSKYVAQTTLHGCLRVVLTSNHHGGFAFGRELTESDVAALDQRVLLLSPSRDAALYLTSIGGRARTEAWVAGGGLARHVRWLETTRQVVPGDRFVVEGRGGLGEFLASDSRGSTPLLRAILRAIRIGNGAVVCDVADQRVWVSRRRLSDDWATLSPDRDPPADMGEAWRLITEPGCSRPRAASRERCVAVQLPLLRRAAVSAGYDDDLGDALGRV